MLLDECVPQRLRHELLSHEVQTVPQMGWASAKNGQLLRLAEADFDAFVTTDQRLSYQQTVSLFDISVIVLVAHRNKLEFLLPLLPELERALEDARPGEVRRVGG